jgi:hypothetical protein
VEDRDGGGRWRGERGDSLKGEGLEGVTCEDGGGFTEDNVAGRLAATEVVVVEGREIVVDEGVGVEHLEGCTKVGYAFGIVFRACDHSCGFDAKDGADTLATSEGAVSHGAVDGVREGIGGGQEAFESGIAELRAGEKQGLYCGLHLVSMINHG